MQHGKYEYKSDFARHYVGQGREEGREEGQLQMARTLLLRLAEDRFGIASVRLQRLVEACGDLGRLTTLFSRISVASDRPTVERLVAVLAPRRTRPARHRHRGSRPARAPQPRARAPRARAARR
jgi:hypothetical protein